MDNVLKGKLLCDAENCHHEHEICKTNIVASIVYSYDILELIATEGDSCLSSNAVSVFLCPSEFCATLYKYFKLNYCLNCVVNIYKEVSNTSISCH